jgi:hypothetical protein
VEWLAYAAMARHSSPMHVVAVLEAFWRSPIDHRLYTQKVIEAPSMLSQYLSEGSRSGAIVLVRSLLQQMSRHGQLRPWIDVDKLAFHLTDSVHQGVCKWAARPDDISSYCQDFAHGPGVMILGAVRDRSVERYITDLASSALPAPITG